MINAGDCWLTYSTFDVKNFLNGHKDNYRITYCNDESLWIISQKMIHYQMLEVAKKCGYVESVKKAYDSSDRLYYVYGDNESYAEIEVSYVYEGYTIGRAGTARLDVAEVFGEPIEERRKEHDRASRCEVPFPMRYR